jgi:hypothetical protein
VRRMIRPKGPSPNRCQIHWMTTSPAPSGTTFESDGLRGRRRLVGTVYRLHRLAAGLSHDDDRFPSRVMGLLEESVRRLPQSRSGGGASRMEGETRRYQLNIGGDYNVIHPETHSCRHLGAWL